MREISTVQAIHEAIAEEMPAAAEEPAPPEAAKPAAASEADRPSLRISPLRAP